MLEILWVIFIKNLLRQNDGTTYILQINMVKTIYICISIKFHLHQMLAIAISKLLPEIWLDIWPFCLAEQSRMKFSWFSWHRADLSVVHRGQDFGKIIPKVLLACFVYSTTSFDVCRVIILLQDQIGVQDSPIWLMVWDYGEEFWGCSPSS